MTTFAYFFNPGIFSFERHDKVVNYTMKKYGFRVEKLDPKNIEKEARDIKQILDNSLPDSWDYLVPPTLEGVIDEFKALVPLYNGNYCYIAQKG